MSAAATSPLPVRDIMPNSVSLSPKNKRAGRNRLSVLLKSSPPESRNAASVNPLPTGAPVSNGVEVSQQPSVDSGKAKDARGIVPASKSKDRKIEVVVETSPVRTAATTKAQGAAVNGSPKSLQAPLRGAHQSISSPTTAPTPLRKVVSETDTPPAEMADSSSELQRSASDINLVDLRARSDTTSSQASRPSIRSAVSETGLVMMNGSTVLERPQAAASLSKETKISRRQSITNRLRGRSRPDPLPATDTMLAITQLPKAMLSPREQVSDPMEERPSTLTKMARRTSWIIGSRSPSPSNKKLQQKVSNESRPTSSGRNESRSRSRAALHKSVSATDVSREEGGESPGKKGRRPLSAFITRSGSFTGSQKPRVNLPKSMSVDRLPASDNAVDAVPEIPKTIPKSKFSQPETPRKKDELWSTFRSLDSDFQKFSSKPSSLKAQVVRSSLLPFLKSTISHPSTKTLRADDLDRRVNVLNKWWVSLLEMLNGRNGQSVSPNDRPAVLEGVAGIMTRPEWRLSLSTLSPSTPSRPPMSRSASSLSSSSSDFLAESVLHNVRNIFVQNLLSQMAFVIERMSLRSVPASVVSFCGKACAYAFFFCPGVAEILVRLWSPSPDAIRRVMKEAGALERTHDPSYATDVLSLNFPPHLKPLAASSFPSLMRYMRSKPRDHIPLSSAYIPWNGPWIGRWSGRDSDLFFVFMKTAVSLITELLPENVSQADWVCVPCAALIQAQLLTVMDATMHRGSSQQDSMEGLPPPTFDDVLGADAVVQPLPPRAPNATRIMAENRLIMLLRECLFSPSFGVEAHVRRTFAHIYGNLIKASTRRVSLYDHNSCFTLCDFLDEAITILSRFYKDEVDPAAWIDWPFWFDVLKKMSKSNNTMTEVRLYSFVYGMWSFLTKDEERKKQICLDWLLDEDFFDHQFNHWCPMVRAYYMRLLCWRIAREDGEANEINIMIFETLLQRMRKAFSWFLALQESAKQAGTVPPSSAPTTPAPGKRLLIIRNDSLPSRTSNGGWEGLAAATSSSTQPNTYQRYTSLNPLLQATDASKKAEAPRDPSPAKKGWFKKMGLFASFTSSTSQSPDSDTDSVHSVQSDVKPSEASTFSSSRLSTMSSASSVQSDTSKSQIVASEPSFSRPQAAASFKFSLEWADKSMLYPRNRRIHPPQLPLLAQQLLNARDESRLEGTGDQAESQKATREIRAIKPQGRDQGAATYCGRAIAEWEMLVKECQGFYERRRREGVDNIKWMEIPTLSVETFRRPVG